MPRGLKALGNLTAATASAFLAFLLVEAVVLHAPGLLLAAVTDVTLEGFRVQRFPSFLPQALTQLPSDASPLLTALYFGGYLPAAFLLLVLGVVAARRAQDWLSLLAAHTICWATFLIALFSGVFGGGRFRLQRALEPLWPALAQSERLVLFLGGGLIGLALFALWAALRSLFDRAADTRRQRLALLAGWLLVPVVIVLALLIAHIANWQALWRWTLARTALAWLVIPLLLSGLPAALWRSRSLPRLDLRFRQAFALVVLAVTAFGALAARTELSRYLARRELTTRTSQYWRLQFDAAALLQGDALSSAADARAAALAHRLGIALPSSPLHACVFGSTDSKTAIAGNDEPFTLDRRRGEVHHLLAPGSEPTDPRGDALLVMRAAWGEPGSDALALALTRHAVGNFHDQPLDAYAGRITREETAHSLREVFGLGTGYLSPLVRDALAGEWVEQQVARRGQSMLPLLYRTPLVSGKEDEFAKVLGTTWDQLERDWQQRLIALAAQHIIDPPPPREPFFHRGISFSHEVGGGWGYGSDRAAAQLQRIKALGATSVAIVPYAFTRAPDETTIFFNTDESDARVIRSIRQAQQLGLRVTLKPQLWGRGFTGHIEFRDPAPFELWFAEYRRWLLHYARMAELHQVDLLVIGTELGGLTGHIDHWRALIRDLRRTYRGPLTYAAHWDKELESLAFWDELDYIGVNFYFPLAAPGEQPRADSPRVRELVEMLAALSRRHGKPVLFTEVGYPAAAIGAAQPWVESGAVDNDLQSRCYEVVFEAFYGQTWLAGMYWWKWPSSGWGQPAGVTFVPLDKPALAVVERWYARPGANSSLSGNLSGRKLVQSGEEGK
ncbi:MAG: glycoside hydrolase family 113 [Candidatus Acidiferrales bacterium]